MDSNNIPQTPVDVTKSPSTQPLLNSSTPPSSTQPQANPQPSSATTTDVVIDYDEAQEEIRQFMAELPSGPFNRDLTLSPPPETPSSAPPTVDPATTARQQQEQELEVQRILSEAQATSTLPGQPHSALSSSPSSDHPLRHLSIPRANPDTERERSENVLSAMQASPMEVDEEMQEVSYTPVATTPNHSRPAPPLPRPAPLASQATPEVEELSFRRYPHNNPKNRSSHHRQAMRSDSANDFLATTLAATLMRLQRSENGAQTLRDACNGTALPPRSRGCRGGQRRQQDKGKGPQRD
ncbi:hypothetical protein JCM10049v2_006093 [Rhodotorula toruloides]